VTVITYLSAVSARGLLSASPQHSPIRVVAIPDAVASGEPDERKGP
jgi:hypothetical protein